jgi:hypothetical protein
MLVKIMFRNYAALHLRMQLFMIFGDREEQDKKAWPIHTK